MITFKQFLEESKSAPLYHATNYGRFESIVDHDVLRATIQSKGFGTQTDNKSVIFLTRDFKHSVWYGQVVLGSPYVVMEFDQATLANRFKIKPILNWSGSYDDDPMKRPIYSGRGYNEFEEIIDRDIKNPMKYVKAVYFNSQSSMKDFISLYEPQNTNALKHIKFALVTDKKR